MIPYLPPYAKTESSGVKWLGKMPDHWDVIRLDAAADLRVSSVDKHTHADEQPVRLCNYVDVYKNDRIAARMTFMAATATPAEVDRFVLAPNDVLVTKDSESWDDIGIPALVAESAPDLLCGYHLALLRPRRSHILGAYLFRVLQSSAGAYQFHCRANGVTRFGLTREAIKSVRIPIPPLPEQAAIVRFFDFVDRRIEPYLQAKGRLSALVEEQNRAAIHRAVTGQIDVRSGQPYPAYKRPGVRWLATVPEHWEVRPLKRLFIEADDRSETGSEELLSVSHITGVTPRSQKNVTMFKPRSTVGYKLCKPGDIVVNTMWAWMAALGVARQVGLVSPSYAVYRPLHPRNFVAEYVDSLLRTSTYQAEYARRSTGIRASRLRLYPDEFLRIRIPRPPLEEQRAIVEFVDRASAEARDAGSLAARQRSLLQQYHKRLLVDVVTGKVDVREAAASLPEVDPLAKEGHQEELVGLRTIATGPLPALDDGYQPADV